MTVEGDIFNLLKGLVTNRAYPDVAPADVARPYIVYQQVGGESISFLEKAVPSKKNGRFQVACWADTRAAAAALALQIESAMVTATAFEAEPIGAPVARYEVDGPLYGTHQHFSIWSER